MNTQHKNNIYIPIFHEMFVCVDVDAVDVLNIVPQYTYDNVNILCCTYVGILYIILFHIFFVHMQFGLCFFLFIDFICGAAHISILAGQITVPCTRYYWYRFYFSQFIEIVRSWQEKLFSPNIRPTFQFIFRSAFIGWPVDEIATNDDQL